MTRRFVVVLAVVSTLFVASHGAASAAAQQPAVDFGPAVLDGGGAVQITATFTCRAGAAGSFTAEIVQSRGQSTAIAYAYEGFTCTGSAQTISTVAMVDDSTVSMRAGIATASGNVLQCDDFDCDSISGVETITIRPR